MRFTVIIALTTSLIMASCGQPTTPKGNALSKDQALLMCKTSSLRARSVVSLPNAVQNIFDACMVGKGYHHAVLVKCNSGYSRPDSNPAYDYISDRINIGAGALEDCYVAAK